MDLTHLFLDLKDGAKIVSLKPFVPESFKMNESNVSGVINYRGPANDSVTRSQLLSSSVSTRITGIGSRGRETRACFTCRSLTGRSACALRRL